MDLDSITVLDLSRLLPGPYATQLLAEMGADVVKIEPPDGDYARHTEPILEDGHGAFFGAVNRGKRSVTLDLKSESGRAAFHRLAEAADVVFEQFRPGVVDRLGIDYESVREHNPEIVYCSLSGYGQTGPYRNRAGHDLNYAGYAGLVDMTRRTDDERPRIPGFPVGDMAGGVFAALSIVGALLSRELGNGGGNYVDVSMTDAVLSFSQAVGVLASSGEDPRPGATDLTGLYPCYDVYETSDGRHLTVAALEPKFWRELCEFLDRPHLIEKHQAESEAVRSAVREELRDAFGSKTREEWAELIDEDDLMVGLVNTPREALRDPHLSSRPVIDRDGDGPTSIGYPAAARNGLDGADGPVPDLGAHTTSVLRAHGFDDEAIEDLRSSGALGDLGGPDGEQ